MILAFEGSAKSASVAVSDNGVILGEFFINAGRTHSETLLPICEALLSSLKLEIGDIDAFAVSAGPGSFTGLRIAIATLKGIMAVTKKRCAPCSTLLSMCYNIQKDCTVCAVMDARCEQVYNALFKLKGGEITRLTPDRAIKISELQEEISGIDDIILVGDGALLCYNSFDKKSDATLAAESVRFQRASSVALAAEKMADADFVEADSLVPTYLRLPQAQRERLAKIKGESV